MDRLAHRSDGRICLVLNGNTFNLRSERLGTYLEATHALNVIQRAVASSENLPLWRALQRFVGTPGCHLAIVLGDRELEIALPAVTQWLVNQLAPDLASRARVFTALDGLGFECSVEGQRILCLHGHEVDPWNAVDHAQLCRLVRAMKRRQAPPPWAPSVGLRLLVDFIEPMRMGFPFLTTLGPMNSKLIPVLVALNPGTMRPIGKLLARQAGPASLGLL